MTSADAQLHLRYSSWASARLVEAVRQLSPEDRERPNGISHGSILGTLAHVYFADWIWYTRVVEPVERPAATLEALERDWPALQARWERWSESLSDADLLRDVSYTFRDGTSGLTPVWQIVLHVVNHATLHRGQVMGLLRQLGVAPPGTDLMAYYQTLPPPHAAR